MTGTWRLSSYNLDYDNGGARRFGGPFPLRVQNLSLIPYGGNRSTAPIAGSTTQVSQFADPGKYVSYVLDGLQPVTLRLIADRATQPVVSTVLSGLFLDRLNDTSCQVSSDCAPPNVPQIRLVKKTNGVYAPYLNPPTPGPSAGQQPKPGNPTPRPAPTAAVGSTVNWTYEVTNTGNVTLTSVTVTDNKLASNAIDCGGGSNIIASLGAGASVTCTASGPALNLSASTVLGKCANPNNANQPYSGVPLYENNAAVTGTPPSGSSVTDTSVSHYCNPQIPAITLLKLTNGVNAPNAVPVNPFQAVPQIRVGGTVTWTYRVTNTGNETINAIVVTDLPFNAPSSSTVSCPFTTLAPGQFMDCFATGIAQDLTVSPNTVPGVCGNQPNKPVYENKGMVTGTSAITATSLSKQYLSHYCNELPGIRIVKYTSGGNVSYDLNATPPNYGADADLPDPTAPIIPVNGFVTWNYVVTNTGNVPLANVVVTDSFSGVTPVYLSGDSNGNGKLDVTEIWVYQAMGVALNLQNTGVTGTCGTTPNTPFYKNTGNVIAQAPSGQSVGPATNPQPLL